MIGDEVTSGHVIPFPAQRAQWISGARQVEAALNALDHALAIASRLYGVVAVWESDAERNCHANPLPSSYLVAGDPHSGRLMLSPVGLSALALVKTLGQGCQTCGDTARTALETALRTLTAQAKTILEVAARVAGAATGWVIAVPTDQGLWRIITAPASLRRQRSRNA